MAGKRGRKEDVYTGNDEAAAGGDTMVVVVMSDGRSYDRDWAETIIISFGPDKRARTREQANRLGEVESRDFSSPSSTFFPSFFSLFSLPPFSFSCFLSQPFLPSDERRSRARVVRAQTRPAVRRFTVR